jgi:hypothetical protein
VASGKGKKKGKGDAPVTPLAPPPAKRGKVEAAANYNKKSGKEEKTALVEKAGPAAKSAVVKGEAKPQPKPTPKKTPVKKH